MKKNDGFTLVEMMIVVAIIGIISAIAFPSYQTYVKESRRADAKVGMTKIADKQERYYLQNDTYTTSLTAIGAKTTSDEGFYTFKMSSADVNGFTITATATGSQVNDTDCTTMELTSTGAKTPDACW